MNWQVAQIAMARPRARPSGNMLVISARVDGARVAPAIPSSARTTISISGSTENAATSDSTANAAAPISSRRRRPIRSPSVPIVMTMPATISPYASLIHSCWTALAPRSALRCGSARISAVMSIATSSVGSMSRASPSQARLTRIS